MKKYLDRILVFLVAVLVVSCIAISSFAWSLVGTLAAPAEGGGCDSCTGNVIFRWHAENANIETGTPCGCSVNSAKDWTLGGTTISSVRFTDGSNSLLRDATTDNATIVIDNSALTAMTITFDVYIHSWANNQVMVIARRDASNYFAIQTTTGTKVLAQHTGNAVNQVSSGAPILENQWQHVVARWRTGVTDPSIYIDVNGDTVNAGIATPNNTAEAAGLPVNLNIGWSGTGNNFFNIDNVVIYNGWVEF